MRAQLGQMESAGQQTDKIIEHAAAQVTALTNAADAAKENAEAAKNSALAAKTDADTALLNTKAFIHSQRPWVSVKISLGSPLLFDEAGARIMLNIALDNVGQMPAMGVWVNPALYVPSSAKHDVREERKRMCEEIAKTIEIGLVVFPGQTTVQHFTIGATSSQIETYSRSVFGDKAAEINMFLAYIIIAVGYCNRKGHLLLHCRDLRPEPKGTKYVGYFRPQTRNYAAGVLEAVFAPYCRNHCRMI